MGKKLFKFGLVLGGLGILVAGAGYWFAFQPNTPDYEGEREVYLPRGISFETAVDSLEASGVLASATSFGWMARLTGWGDQIKAGHYTFAENASNYDLLTTLRRGLQTPVRLTIPPGTRPEVVAGVAGRVMAFDAADFRAALRDPALATTVGTDTTYLFAYMMPETYFFYWLTDADDVVKKIAEDAQSFIKKAHAEAPSPPDLTPDEVLNLAGIVEWETAHVPEKPRVAGVYLNRLNRGWPLQADPTVQYAILASEGQKRRLLFRDYDVDHPYNTYQFRGLPPGPVTNPSPTSISAVLAPEDHDFFFFVANGDGTHTFSRTLREHNRAAADYRLLMQQRRREAARADSSN